MNDVFISYSRKDSDFAHLLNEHLEQNHNSAWVDWKDLPLTAPNWWVEIKEGIENSHNFVFIMSPDSMASVVCNLELDYAIELRKRIVPVAYREVSSHQAFASIKDYKPDEAMADRLNGKNPLTIATDNWRYISDINWVPFPDKNDFYPSFQRLVSAVETDLQHVKEHTRYFVRAQEWKQKNYQPDLLLVGEEVDAAETWLAAAAAGKGKNYSEPSALHREYISQSRIVKNERDLYELRLVRQGRNRLRLLVGVLCFALIGALFFVILLDNENERANFNAEYAQTQASIAIRNEAQAVMQEATAVRLANEAQTRVLSVYAGEAAERGDRMLALNLALEATSIESPPFDATQMLFELAYASQPIAHWSAPAQEDGTPLVTAMAYNPSEEKLIVAARSLYEFETTHGQLIHQWPPISDINQTDENEQQLVTSLAYSPDGSRLVLGYSNGQVFIYDALTRRLLYEPDQHDDTILRVMYAPDGRHLISVSANKLSSWDANNGTLVKSFYDAAEIVLIDASLSNDHVVAVAYQNTSANPQDSMLMIWDSGENEPRLIPLDQYPFGVAVNQSGDAILINHATGVSIYDWDGNEAAQYPAPLPLIAQYCGPQENFLTLTSNGSVTHHSMNDSEQIFSVGETIYKLACDPGGTQLALGTVTGGLYFWDIGPGDAVVMPRFWLGANSEPFDTDTGELIVFSQDLLQLQKFNPATAEYHTSFEPVEEPNKIIAFQVAGSYVVATYIDNRVAVWDKSDGKLLNLYENRSGAANLFDVSLDGQLAVNYTPDTVTPEAQGLAVWDVSTGENLYFLAQERIGVVNQLFRRLPFVPQSYAFAPDGKSLATVGLMETSETGLLIWHFVSDTLRPITLNGLTVVTLAYSPDGSQLLVGEAEGGVTLWDVAQGELIATLDGLSGLVYSLDFSPNGQRALGSDSNGNIVLWDLESTLILRHLQYPGSVFTTAFSPDSQHFAVTRMDEGRFSVTLHQNDTLSSLRNWIESNRYIRPLTCLERSNFRIFPLCSS